MDHAQLVNGSRLARHAAWSLWGRVDEDVITHLVNPAFLGGPAWPNVTQAYRTARRPGEVLLASDGLSDPPPLAGRTVSAPALNGLGLEIFATAPDPGTPVTGSWLWDMVWHASNQVAHHGGIARLLRNQGLLSMELHGVKLPPGHRERFTGQGGRVGILIGQTDSRPPVAATGPLSAIRLVNVKLLTAAELAHVIGNAAAGRRELARRFAAQGSPLRSDLDRASVI